MGGTAPCWARPRPWPERARRSGPAGTGARQYGPGTRDNGRPRRRYGGEPAALDLAVALGDSALQMQASHTLGQAYYAIGDFGRRPRLLRRNVEAADRQSGTPRTDVRILSQAALARTLGTLGGIRRGPAPRGGGTAPRHAGRSRSHADHCPRLLSQLYLAQETWSTPSGCTTRACPWCVPPAAGTCCP